MLRIVFDHSIIIFYFCLSVCGLLYFFFFFNDTATTEIYTLSLHDALPICGRPGRAPERFLPLDITSLLLHVIFDARFLQIGRAVSAGMPRPISYAVFCLKKKKK